MKNKTALVKNSVALLALVLVFVAAGLINRLAMRGGDQLSIVPVAGDVEEIGAGGAED